MPTDPQRVQSLFLAAVERPPSERAAFLDRECGADADLRQRVEALLRAHDAPGRFLESFPPELGAGHTLDLPVAERPGATIGHYTLLEQIGEGGFGVVYLAEQQEPVHRKVALKVLKAGMDTRQVVARFEAERQALALMDHPHIAKVFDGGTTGEPSGKGVRNLLCEAPEGPFRQKVPDTFSAGRIHLYDAATLPPRLLARLETPERAGNLVGVSLSPDGARLAATIDYNNTVALWDLRLLRNELASLDLDWDMPPYPPEDHAGEPAQTLSVNVIPDLPSEAGAKGAPVRDDPASKPTPPDAGMPMQTEKEGQGKPETPKKIPNV